MSKTLVSLLLCTTRRRDYADATKVRFNVILAKASKVRLSGVKVISEKIEYLYFIAIGLNSFNKNSIYSRTKQQLTLNLLSGGVFL